MRFTGKLPNTFKKVAEDGVILGRWCCEVVLAMMMCAMGSRQVPGGRTAAPANVEEYLAVFRLLAEAVVEQGEAATQDDRWEEGRRTTGNSVRRVGRGDSMEYSFDPSKGL